MVCTVLGNAIPASLLLLSMSRLHYVVHFRADRVPARAGVSMRAAPACSLRLTVSDGVPSADALLPALHAHERKLWMAQPAIAGGQGEDEGEGEGEVSIATPRLDAGVCFTQLGLQVCIQYMNNMHPEGVMAHRSMAGIALKYGDVPGSACPFAAPLSLAVLASLAATVRAVFFVPPLGRPGPPPRRPPCDVTPPFAPPRSRLCSYNCSCPVRHEGSQSAQSGRLA